MLLSTKSYDPWYRIPTATHDYILGEVILWYTTNKVPIFPQEKRHFYIVCLYELHFIILMGRMSRSKGITGLITVRNEYQEVHVEFCFLVCMLGNICVCDAHSVMSCNVIFTLLGDCWWKNS